MKPGPERKYTITSIGCMGLFLLYLFFSSEFVRADVNEDSILQGATTCIAVNTLLYEVQGVGGHGTDLVSQEIDWWVGFAVGWFDASAVQKYGNMKIDIGAANYESGLLTLQDLIAAGTECLKLKEELIAVQ